MVVVPSPLQNHILEALPVPVRERLFPHLKLITLPRGAVLYEAGAPVRQVYFPTDCIVSLLYVLENGASAEISVVGNEGAHDRWRSNPAAAETSRYCTPSRNERVRR